MHHSTSGLRLSGIFHVLACALVIAAPSLVQGQVQQRAKLVASDGEERDRFGWSVGISGGVAVVGAPKHDGGARNKGAAYVFERTPGGRWTQVAKPTEAEGEQREYFGWGADVDGDTVIIGSPLLVRGGTDRGGAFSFERSGGAWPMDVEFFAGRGQEFGYCISVERDQVMIGVPGADNDDGEMFIFDRSNGEWELVRGLEAPDSQSGDRFGAAVAIRGDLAVAGAYGDDDSGYNSGSAHVFGISGKRWEWASKLVPREVTESDLFGFSVAVAGRQILVGAPQHDGTGFDSGAVFVFEADEKGDWGEIDRLTPGDGASGDQFGYSLAASSELAVIGAIGDDDRGRTAGSAYVFQFSNGRWSHLAKLTADDAQAGDLFGFSVAVDSERVLIGAPRDDDRGESAGAAYVFEIDGK